MSHIRTHMIWMMCLFAIQVADGQTKNNTMRINDSIYAIYQRGLVHRTDPLSLIYCDSMVMLAKKYHDPKAEVIAYTMPLEYYFSINDAGNLRQVANRCKKVARRTGYLQYFYFSYTQEVTLLVNQYKFDKAKKMTEEVMKYAKIDKEDYGWGTCYNLLGLLYLKNKQYNLAIESFTKCLDFYIKAKQRATVIYINIAHCYLTSKKNLQKTLHYYNLALESCINDEQRLNVLLDKCTALFYFEDYDKMEKVYLQCQTYIKKYDKPNTKLFIDLKLYHYIVTGNIKEFNKLVVKIPNEIDRTIQKRNMAVCQKNYKQANELGDSLIVLYRETSEQTTQKELAELSANMDNSHLKMINAELKLKEQQQETAFNNRIFIFIIILFVTVIISTIYYVRMKNHSIKHLREAWNEAHESEQRALNANRMKTLFIQNMSHEIRTPLNAICGFSQLLSNQNMAENMSVEEKTEYGDLINTNTKMLTTLIDDILSLSEMESGKYKITMKHCCPNSICSLAMKTSLHRCHDNVKMYFTTDIPNEYLLYTDKDRMLEVMINFLTNAIKYTLAGEIHIHCSILEHPGKVTFSVADTGVGVPAEKAEFIFSRFEKLDDFKQGIGLGLTICKKIAELLYGEVYLDTTYKGGAKFVFEHPIHNTK